jgi:hypothetical protein
MRRRVNRKQTPQSPTLWFRGAPERRFFNVGFRVMVVSGGEDLR